MIIGDKDYPIQTGYAALRLFCAKHDPQLEFDELFEHFKNMDFSKTTNQLLDDFSLLLWCFVERGCKKQSIENELTIDDVIDWIGKERQIDKIIELLYESYGVDISKLKEEAINDESKKKD